MQERLWMVMRAFTALLSVVASVTTRRGPLFWALTATAVALFAGVTLSYWR